MTPLFFLPISRSTQFCFLAIIILGITIRVIGITTPLNGDELATVSIWANMPLLDIPTHYEYPNNHIFHTLIVATIYKTFGLNPFLLRAPVLVFGIASIALAFFTTHRITRNSQAGLAVSLLVAINGGHIFYSTHARGYMLTLLIGQYIFHRLIVWRNENKNLLRASQDFFTLKELSVFLVLMTIGTWTIPTFVFFEGSLGLFFLISFFQSKPNKWFDISSPYLKNLVVLLICLLSLFIQYFILISPEMLKLAFSNAAQSELSSFPTSILKEWIQPINSGGVFFVIFALIGLYMLFHLNRMIFILIVCLLIFPPMTIYIASHLGLLKIIPHARIFFYLQPIFILCIVIGALGLVSRLRNKLRELVGKIVLGSFFLIIIVLSGKELIQITWPDRFSGQRLDLVARFVKNLGSNDLVLLSNRPHVEYYLYGGKETTKRINKILEEGKLGDIYFVEYGKAGKSDTLRINKNSVEYFLLKDYPQIIKTNQKSEGILIPVKLFKSKQQIGDFTFRKVNPKYINNSYTLRSPQDLKRWKNMSHSRSLTLEPPFMNPGKLAALRIEEPSILVAKTETKLDDVAFSININLLSSERNLGNKVSYLHAMEENGQYVFKNSWLINNWILDHPYGPNILNRPWRTKIFITDGRQPIEVIRTPDVDKREFGRLRGIQSYRLVMMKNSLKNNGDKL